MKFHLSKYALLFERDGKYLLYFSQVNSFYEVNSELYSFLLSLKDCPNVDVQYNIDDTIKKLIDLQILVTNETENDYIDSLQTLNAIQNFNSANINLTIAPTIQCNLRCPYCFEETKPLGFMSLETIDALQHFVSEHTYAKTYSITWFGGEPLLALPQMRTIIEKLQEIEDKSLQGHGIITNGTLLNDDAIKLFQNYPLGSIQITLDGNQEQHDSKRFHASGKGSFDIILRNVDNAIKALPDTMFSFRINVDNTNCHSYIEVANMLKDRYSGCKNINFYAGILRANKGCHSEQFFSTKDHISFSKKVAKAGLISGLTYPSLQNKGCGATCVSSYVIGPMGEIYLCWEHVGRKEKIIGNIKDKSLSNPVLRNRFLNHGHCLNDPECRKCALLPICNGGCPNERIENLFEGAKHSLCALYHADNGEVLYDVLYDYYLNRNKRQTV